MTAPALRLLIGNKNSSSWSLRPWLALSRSGLPFEEELVRFGSAEWKLRLLPLSPTAKVPLLVHGDLVIWDSLAICEYLAELAPQLWPSDRARRAEARSICAEFHSGFSTLRTRLSMNITARVDPGAIEPQLRADLDRVFGIWRSCRGRFASDGPFLFGSFSIADAFYAPVVTRFITYGIDVPEDGRRYMDTILALPELQAWTEAAREEIVEQR